uniref:Gamma carbonic anhydrase 1 n=1 Tax=Ulva prolifera TaxID=3117 RepID=A0A7S4YHY9_ULVPR|nr:gamma carbonic anhydrase 1 [Ulva prolifera]
MERLMPPVNRLKFRGVLPTYPESCFVAPNATVMGNVTMGEGSSIWYGATLRGDVNSITIGEMTNIQDKAVIHVAQHNPAKAALPTVVGSHVTIGHGAILHACTIEDEVLVGMGAKVLDGAIVRRGAIVGGGAVVAPGTEVPSGQVWAGCPARYLRDVDASESAFLAVSAHNYA